MMLVLTGKNSKVDEIIIMLDTSMMDVVTGGSVIRTVMVLVRYKTTPLVVSGQVSLMVSVATGRGIVVIEESVHGGKTSVHGGSQAAVGS
jgi:hypothetical protein